MLKTNVLLTQVTNLSDARYASGMGVDYIGFAVNPENDRYVTPEAVKMIKEWLSGVEYIGDIEGQMPDNWDEYAFDGLQTNNENLLGNSSKAVLTLSLSKETLADVAQKLKEYQTNVSFFVVKVAAQELPAISDNLQQLCSAYPVYLSTKFNPENVEQTVDTINPAGIVLYGSQEEKPGFSSYDGIADILEQLEVD